MQEKKILETLNARYKAYSIKELKSCKAYYEDKKRLLFCDDEIYRRAEQRLKQNLEKIKHYDEILSQQNLFLNSVIRVSPDFKICPASPIRSEKK